MFRKLIRGAPLPDRGELVLRVAVGKRSYCIRMEDESPFFIGSARWRAFRSNRTGPRGHGAANAIDRLNGLIQVDELIDAHVCSA